MWRPALSFQGGSPHLELTIRAIAHILSHMGARGERADGEACNCSALRRAARTVSRLYDDALAPVGLGVSQYAILSRLERAQTATLADLADLLGMDRSTLGHLLRPLESRGLLKLTVSPTDRRARAVALTPEGAAVLASARTLWSRAQRRFEGAYGKAAARDLRRTLQRVTMIGQRA
jgi:DNA-binding MarR family transcriptional regulator